MRSVHFIIFSFLFLFLLGFSTLAQNCQEGQTRECGYSDIGECSYGTQACENGEWSICFGGQGPIDEICDDTKDNDCDGEIDEGCACSAGETRECIPGDYEEIGICQYGFELCTTEGDWTGECLNATLPFDDELCGAQGIGNKLDDNCNGIVDENCDVPVEGPPSHCFNRQLDTLEEAVDCGGPCEQCNDCSNGIKERDEERTSVAFADGSTSDCGGLNCPTCPTCTDGKQNQEEDDVDCGGPCSPCQTLETSDEDNDGLIYQVELTKGTSPNNPDTDFDGVLDGQDDFPLCPNDFCDSGYGETKENCPEDCRTTTPFARFLIIFIFLLLIIAVVFYLMKHKKKSKLVQENNKQTVTSGRPTFRSPQHRIGKQTKKETDAEKKLRESIEAHKKL